MSESSIDSKRQCTREVKKCNQDGEGGEMWIAEG